MKKWWIWFDYGVLLPALTLLPQKIGRYFASLRGALYYTLKRDWRSFTFGDDGLWERTYSAYGQICPHLSHDERSKLVRQRYVYQSIEEFEGALLDKDRFTRIKVDFIGVENIKQRIAKNPHVVFITAHFGSSLLGIALLKRLGIPLLGMSSNVVEHEKVHPTLTEFFLKKYRGISRYMNGGRSLDIEGNGKRFLSFLKKRGSLVIIADLPPSNPNEEPVWKMFFGVERGFAAGAERLAKSVNAEIVPFVCYYESGGYVVKFGDFEQDPYGFLEKEFEKRPQMWWAADLLDNYPKRMAKTELMPSGD